MLVPYHIPPAHAYEKYHEHCGNNAQIIPLIALGRGSEANDRECTEASIYTVCSHSPSEIECISNPKRIIGRSLSKRAISLLEGFHAAAAPIDAYSDSLVGSGA